MDGANFRLRARGFSPMLWLENALDLPPLTAIKNAIWHENKEFFMVVEDEDLWEIDGFFDLLFVSSPFPQETSRTQCQLQW